MERWGIRHFCLSERPSFCRLAYRHRTTSWVRASTSATPAVAPSASPGDSSIRCPQAFIDPWLGRSRCRVRGAVVDRSFKHCTNNPSTAKRTTEHVWLFGCSAHVSRLTPHACPHNRLAPLRPRCFGRGSKGRGGEEGASPRARLFGCLFFPVVWASEPARAGDETTQSSIQKPSHSTP
jgi:hypothetical protein